MLRPCWLLLDARLLNVHGSVDITTQVKELMIKQVNSTVQSCFPEVHSDKKSLFKCCNCCTFLGNTDLSAPSAFQYLQGRLFSLLLNPTGDTEATGPCCFKSLTVSSAEENDSRGRRKSFLLPLILCLHHQV